MASKKVLGRGLGAFFPDYDDKKPSEKTDSKLEQETAEKTISEPPRQVKGVLEVEVQNVRPNPHQPRREFNEQHLDELAASIKKHGLIQPITVRYLGEKRFELISGERRLRACRRAGLATLPAYIREANDEEIISFALIENIQREDLNPIEVALGYQRLMEEAGHTQAEVAEKVGKNRSTITNMLRLLALPAFVQAALRDGSIRMGHARALISINSKSDQKKLFETIIEKGYSVRQTEEAVRRLDKKPKKKPRRSSSQDDRHAPIFKEISSRLRRTLSTKVDIKSKKKGGEIRIEFYSDDELERLLELFESIS